MDQQQMMAFVQDLLLNALNDLTTLELKKFQWHLNHQIGIPASNMENSDVFDTISMVTELFNSDGAVKITSDILRKINKKMLAEQLQNKHREEVDHSQMMAFVQDLLLNSLSDLTTPELEEFQWHLNDHFGIPAANMENSNLFDTINKVTESFNSHGAVKIPSDILRKMNKKLLAEQFQNKHREEVDHRQLMAFVRDLLLNSLNDLTTAELKKFQWHLNHQIGIPASNMENSDVFDTISMVTELFNSDGAVKITLDILRKINKKMLAEQLQNTHREEVDHRQMMAFVQDLLLNSLNDLTTPELEEFQWHLNHQIDIPAANMENSNLFDTINMVMESFNSDGAVKITSDILRKMNKKMLAEQFQKKHREEVDHRQLMAFVRELLLNSLNDLTTPELEEFQWHLNHQIDIPASNMENSDVFDTINKVMESFNSDGAVKITSDILRKMNKKMLAEQLQNKHREEVDHRQMMAFVQELLLNSLNDLTTAELEEFQRHLNDHFGIPAANMENSDVFDTINMVMESFNSDGAVKITSDILRKMNKKMLAEQLQNKHREEVDHHQMMPFVQDFLLNSLNDLTTPELEEFQWHLNDHFGIPAANMENSNLFDTINKVTESFNSDGAVKITSDILRKMKKNMLAEQLQNKHREEVDHRQMMAFVQDLLLNSLNDLTTHELEEFQWHLNHQIDIPASNMENSDVFDTINMVMESFNSDGAVKITSDILRKMKKNMLAEQLQNKHREEVDHRQMMAFVQDLLLNSLNDLTTHELEEFQWHLNHQIDIPASNMENSDVFDTINMVMESFNSDGAVKITSDILRKMKKNMLAEQLQNKHREEVDHRQMMAFVQELLLNSLNDLTTAELEEFQRHLNDHFGIPAANMENSDVFDTINMVMESFNSDGAVKITSDILRKMNKKMLAEQLQNKHREEVDHHQMMPFVQDFLLNSLNDLTTPELEEFQWHLNDHFGIPAANMENSNLFDTINKVTESFNSDGAVKITSDILRKMKKNMLAEQLQNKHREEVDHRQMMAFVQDLLLNSLNDLTTHELEEFQWHLNHQIDIPASNMENSDVFDTINMVMESFNSDGAVKITSDILRKMKKNMLAEQLQNKHREEVDHRQMMAFVQDLLLNSLNDLTTHELEEFQWHLNHQIDIPASNMENSDVFDTINMVMESFNSDGAVKITSDILRKMKKNMLAEQLQNKHREEVDHRQMMAFVQDLLLNSLNDLTTHELEEFQWHLNHQIDIPASNMENSDVFDTINMVMESFNSDGAVKITSDILRKMKKNMLAEQLQNKHREEVDHHQMMAFVQELLLNSLSDLTTPELEEFQWHLNDHFGIPAANMENSDVFDTINKVMESFNSDEAVKITSDILRKMKKNMLTEQLQNKHREGSSRVDSKAVDVQYSEFSDRLKKFLKQKYERMLDGGVVRRLAELTICHGGSPEKRLAPPTYLPSGTAAHTVGLRVVAAVVCIRPYASPGPRDSDLRKLKSRS
ncbi:hypothetical protein E1301_Tti023040 [Triplophysa tibetana]|uniref:Pyrin domain-containing protein n=1 Tax=Triplophysa tibetana TaxID=1572043 RepID=A0A5A9PIJ0_9TELE|nr:hypothetical protein E1301_Tti023040 [Triplophysa tibetana]